MSPSFTECDVIATYKRNHAMKPEIRYFFWFLEFKLGTDTRVLQVYISKVDYYVFCRFFEEYLRLRNAKPMTGSARRMQLEGCVLDSNLDPFLVHNWEDNSATGIDLVLLAGSAVIRVDMGRFKQRREG
jgi:hypothetical protein